MRFYTQQHRHYCGIDLHARTMFVCIIDQAGAVLVEKNIRARPEAFLDLIAPYRDDLVVGVECIFTWYWLADLCEEEGIAFVLGQALYMKAIHGGKAKNDRIDAGKIAALLRGGMLPRACVYPRRMRSTLDLLRRRLHLVRHRGRLLAHIQNTNHQCNHDDFRKKLTYKANRDGVAEQFADPSVRKSVEVDLALIAHYDGIIRDLELFIVRMAKQHDADAFHRLLLGGNPGRTTRSAVAVHSDEDPTHPPSHGTYGSHQCEYAKTLEICGTAHDGEVCCGNACTPTETRQASM